MTELEVRQTNTPVASSPLRDQMDYARALAASALLPQDYKGKPENVLIAMSLGQSMGLSPAESLYRISVIQGKPTASAELIAASVRKAGHKLRVTGDDTTATATIIRHDDPDYEFTTTRDIAWAQKMGLANNNNYKKQPGTMLQWRAITAVARIACPEALYGVAYTPDEMFDLSPEPAPTSGRARLADALETSESATEDPAEPLPINSGQRKLLMKYAGELGLTREQRMAGICKVIGREVESSNNLTLMEAAAVLNALETRLKQIAFEDDAHADMRDEAEAQDTLDKVLGVGE